MNRCIRLVLPMASCSSAINDTLSIHVIVCMHSQRWRETSEEKRAKARLQDQMLSEVRQAAEVHRQVSYHIPALSSTLAVARPCSSLDVPCCNLKFIFTHVLTTIKQPFPQCYACSVFH